MGTQISQTEAQFLADKRIQWQAIIQLLKEKKYEQTAKLLNDFEFPEQDRPSRLGPILASAQQICLVCRQVQAEIDLHQQAYLEAYQRERELQHQLALILDLIERHMEMSDFLMVVNDDADETDEKSHSEQIPGDRARTWWQRLRNRLRWVTPATIPVQTPLETAGQEGKSVVGFTTQDLSERPESAPIQTTTPGVDETAVLALSGQPEKQGHIPSLEIYCLGTFRVYQNEQLIKEWNGVKGQLILKYLIVNHGKPCAKDILMNVFWPDVGPEAARRNLHQAIYSLRQTLRRKDAEFQHILYENDHYLLNPVMTIWIDCKEFETHAQAGQQLEIGGQIARAVDEYSIAESLYQGGFLAEDLYEEWVIPRREDIKNLYLHIADRLSQYYMQQHAYTAVLVLCQKLLNQDKCYEAAHRRIMKCHIALAQRHLAIRQYHTCRQILRDELDIVPSEETTILYQRITH